MEKLLFNFYFVTVTLKRIYYKAFRIFFLVSKGCSKEGEYMHKFVTWYQCYHLTLYISAAPGHDGHGKSAGLQLLQPRKGDLREVCSFVCVCV